MARAILVMGESGAGKTTSLRNLPSTSTYFIDADKKHMAWKGFRKQYNTENKNYIAIDEPQKVYSLLKNISEKAPNIKYIVVDTLNGVMVGEEMRQVKTKGYDKWMDLASYIYNIIDCVGDLRDDLVVIFTAHSETDRDDNGYMFTRMKTTGRKLNKIVPESKLNIVLLAKRKEGKYIFETKANNSTAKTPFGMFETDEIENDIMLVINELEDY